LKLVLRIDGGKSLQKEMVGGAKEGKSRTL
jgi:hypothetical protein